MNSYVGATVLNASDKQQNSNYLIADVFPEV